MRDFAARAGFDLAITMLNSACHLFTLDDIVAHLAAVAAHLVPGGLYIVELAHPADYLAAGAEDQQRVDDRGGRHHRRGAVGRRRGPDRPGDARSPGST